MATTKIKTEQTQEAAATIVAAKATKAAPADKKQAGTTVAVKATNKKQAGTTVAVKATKAAPADKKQAAKATKKASGTAGKTYAVGESLPVYLL